MSLFIVADEPQTRPPSLHYAAEQAARLLEDKELRLALTAIDMELALRVSVVLARLRRALREA